MTITVVIAFFARILRQPLIVTYIIAGIICGPFFLNLFHDDQTTYKTFAQFGVILLLFVIGLNLNFNHLKSIGKISVITGLGQVIFTAGIGFIILLALQSNIVSALYLAIAITFSSTIIIMKLLSEKKDTDTTYGRYTIGLMLVQDIIAIFLIIALGMIQANQNISLDFISLFLIKLILTGIVLYLASRYVLPKILDKIADSTELLFLFALAWCLGIASLLSRLGLSLEIGAIVSGIALSSSPYQFEIGSRLRPLRDFFLILFFVVLGSEMQIGSIAGTILPATILSGFVLIGNPLILYILFRKLKFTRRNSFLASITAAQVSEFGFVLLFAGRQAGHIIGNEVTIFTAIALATIFISSYLISYNEQIYRFLLPLFNYFGKDQFKQKTITNDKIDIWIVGYHRIGIKIAQTMHKLKKKFSVIDFDPTVIPALRKNNIPFYFGDIADIEFLENLPIANCKMIIMTIPAIDDQINLIQYIRKTNSRVLIIANAYHQRDNKTLYDAGADFVMMPHLLGGEWIARILHKEKWTKTTLKQLKNKQKKLFSY